MEKLPHFRLLNLEGRMRAEGPKSLCGISPQRNHTHKVEDKMTFFFFWCHEIHQLIAICVSHLVISN